MGDHESLSYVRLYADADGETHFEDVVVATSEQRMASGAWIALSDLVPVTGLEFRLVIEDHPRDDPHNAPRRQFIITLAGDHEVTVSDGETRAFGPGSVVLVEDTEGKGHLTRPTGPPPRVTLFAPLPL
jgi:quercetin dioxygenase-like cupin family protein